MENEIINIVLPMEANAEGQSDLERMLCTICLQVAAVIEEILQAGLDVEANVRGEIILSAKAE